MIKNVTDSKEISDAVMQMQLEANKQGVVDFNAFKIYRVLYDQEPSCKHLLRDGECYDSAMRAKYSRIFETMKNIFSEKAQQSLEKVIEAFRNGTIAEKCATATFPMPNIPSAIWSLGNRWLCLEGSRSCVQIVWTSCAMQAARCQRPCLPTAH